MSKESPAKLIILKDTREQVGWEFSPSDWCEGTQPATLKTGDYTIAGLEDKFVIERKRNTAEVAMNLFEPRFFKELERMRNFEQPYLFFEFDLENCLSFPVASGIPRSRWDKLRMTGPLMLKMLLELQINYPHVRMLFVNSNRSVQVATSIFKRIAEHYGKAEGK